MPISILVHKNPFWLLNNMVDNPMEGSWFYIRVEFAVVRVGDRVAVDADYGGPIRSGLDETTAANYIVCFL